jgi:hypothetical protein
MTEAYAEMSKIKGFDEYWRVSDLTRRVGVDASDGVNPKSETRQ